MLRQISLVAALVGAMALPSVAMARGGHGGHGGFGHFGGAHVGAGAWHGAGAFRPAAVFHGRHVFVSRHFRHGRLFVGGLGVYGYGSFCYQPVLTSWGWRWRWVCGYDSY